MKDWMNLGTSYSKNSQSAVYYQKLYSRKKKIVNVRHLNTLYTQYSISFNNLIHEVAYRPEECFNSRHSPC